jgi:hypothetical protein
MKKNDENNFSGDVEDRSLDDNEENDKNNSSQQQVEKSISKNSRKKSNTNNCNKSKNIIKSCQFAANNVPEVHFGTFDMDEEEAHEIRLRDITNMLRWDAKCKGVAYLGEDELHNHNRNVKVSPLSTWI